MTPPALTSAILPTPHGFFTRQGGVSTGPYASLNCSASSQDDPANVAENRDRVRRALGATYLLGVHQVHGNNVVTVTQPWPPGSGEKADAMVTNRPGIALGVITADCTPVLLHDPAGIIGAVHAGWRSAVGGVLEATIAAMQALGATTITAAIGPCIRQPSYEVGPDLRDAILAATPAAQTYFAKGRRDHWQFDLAGYCAHRLQGLAKTNTIDADTLPDETRFFSHRRRTLAAKGASLQPIGHQISAIAL